MIVLHWRERATTEAGTFTARLDGDVILLSGRARRTDVSRPLDLILPCFPLTRSGWRPAHDRHVFYMRRLGAEGAEVLGVPFAPGDREVVVLSGIPEVILNAWFRIAEHAARRRGGGGT